MKLKLSGKGPSAILLLLFVVIVWFAGIQLGLYQGRVEGRNEYCTYMVEVARLNGNSFPVKSDNNKCYISLGVVGGVAQWSEITPELMQSISK